MEVPLPRLGSSGDLKISQWSPDKQTTCVRWRTSPPGPNDEITAGQVVDLGNAKGRGIGVFPTLASPWLSVTAGIKLLVVSRCKGTTHFNLQRPKAKCDYGGSSAGAIACFWQPASRAFARGYGWQKVDDGVKLASQLRAPFQPLSAGHHSPGSGR